jgi:hypothetical protein
VFEGQGHEQRGDLFASASWEWNRDNDARMFRCHQETDPEADYRDFGIWNHNRAAGTNWGAQLIHQLRDEPGILGLLNEAKAGALCLGPMKK